MSSVDLERIHKLAMAARDQKAPLGEDIDISAFTRDVPDNRPVEELTEYRSFAEKLTRVGMDLDEKDRSGSFLEMDHSVVRKRSRAGGLVVEDMKKALDEEEWLHDLWWTLVSPDTDKYTARTALDWDKGYFIHVKENTKVEQPVQSCMLMGHDGMSQIVHNIIYVEKGASLNILSGCASGTNVERGLHIGVSEIFVEEGASLDFTMIHDWGKELHVRPRTAVRVADGGSYISNYMLLEPVRSIQSYPKVVLGSDATAALNTTSIAYPGSDLDLGGKVLLQGEGASADILSRAVSVGGRTMSRGRLEAMADRVRAHLECKALILEEGGVADAVPELASSFMNVDMSHEASVGRIGQQEIEYLQARGLSEDQAVSAIVRGFLDIEIKGLPPGIRARMDRVVSSLGQAGL